MKVELKNFTKAWRKVEKFLRIAVRADAEAAFEAADRKISIRCKVKEANILEPGCVAVTGLREILKSSESVIIEQNTLTAGTFQTHFVSDAIPEIPDSSRAEEICSIKGQDLKRIITQGVTAADLSKTGYKNTCLVNIDKDFVKCTSCDNARLAVSMCESVNTVKKENLVLPAAELKKIAKFLTSDVKILANDLMVWFVFDDTEISICRLGVEFPRYERFYETRTTLKIAAKDLMLKKFEKYVSMELNPDKGQIVIADSTSNVVINADVKGSYLRLNFNTKYLNDGLKALGNGEARIEFSGDFEPIRMFGENFFYLLMPLRSI